jgi:hypothetical protein
MCALIFKSSQCPNGRLKSHFAPCLQGGGVFVQQGGSVTIDSCTISGNAASVRVHVQKFPWPRWENCLHTRFDSLAQLRRTLLSTIVCYRMRTCLRDLKFSIVLMGRLLTCLPRFTLAQL